MHAALLVSVFPSVEKLISNHGGCYIYSDETDIRIVDKFVELLYFGETVNISGDEEQEIETFLVQWNISISTEKTFCPLDETLVDFISVDEHDCSVVPFIDETGVKDYENNLEDSNFNIEGTSFARSQHSVPSFDVPIARKAICSRLCNYNCTENLKFIASHKLQSLSTIFKNPNGSSCSSQSVRNNLLHYLKSQDLVGFDVDCYVFQRQSFCLDYFSHLTGISKYILKSTLSDFWAGRRIYEHGNSGISKQQTMATIQFVA